MNPGRGGGDKWLDTILAGVSIADKVYGIKSAMDENDRKEEDRAAAKADRDYAKDEEKRKRLGIRTPGEIQDYRFKGYEEVAPGTEGGITVPLEGGGKTGLRLPQQKEKPVAVQTVENGRVVTKFVVPREGETYEAPKQPGDGASSPQGQFKKLAPEDQEIIKDLGKSNAKKLTIANQIESTMANWDKLDEDGKLAQGRMLLKVLNSTEGADAIGAEEAKRLGAKLQYAMGNFFNDNPVQFGRDLEGFKADALQQIENIRGAIKANEGEIDKRYGRPAVIKPPGDAAPPAQPAPAPIDRGGVEKGIRGAFGGAPAPATPPPGSIVQGKNGKKYKVGTDGETLEEIR